MNNDSIIYDKSLSNYEKAKIEADRIDAIIIDTLKSGKSFRVEAGAGSGKTYSLNKVVDWLQANYWNRFKKRQQQIACITYTNTAVDVISSRLKTNSFIIPSTIHSFAWTAMKQFNSTLVRLVKEKELLPEDSDPDDINYVNYTLGHRYIEDKTLFLYHNDVIILFSAMLDNQKFRAILSQKYPIVLIDEYQDSFSSIMDKFKEYFISKEKGPQFGLFGDAWQTIYQTNKACGLVTDERLIEIKKVSNFRSAPNIVKVLNKLRPNLPQISAIDDFQGEVLVVTCNDFTGTRRVDGQFKGDLPPEELSRRLKEIENLLNIKKSEKEKNKILMITHKVLASQQGYLNLLNLLDDSLKDKEDPFLFFFMNTVEPIFKALNNKDMNMLFDTLGVRRFPIETKAQKNRWNNLLISLEDSRTKKVKDIMDIVISSELVPIPPEIEKYYKSYKSGAEIAYQKGTLGDLMNISYSEFINAISFLEPDAEFSTHHGVKGEEYDNVIFVISAGWNQYRFDVYLPMDQEKIPADKLKSYERNRNLFYVGCSRPIRRLILFISILVNKDFESYLKSIFGDENVLTYSEVFSKQNLCGDVDKPVIN